VWIAEIMSRTYQSHNGRTGLEVVTSDTCNISEYVDFSFYDQVWFWHTPLSQEPTQPGCWLGVSHRVGTALCYWVLTRKGSVLLRLTVQNVTELKMHIDENKKLFDDIDIEIKRKMESGAHAIELLPNMLYLEDEPADEPDCFNDGGFVPDVDNVDRYDEYIRAKLMFDFMGDDVARGRVIKRAKGEDGQPLGTRNVNPILDTRMYTVQLSDGSHCELSANIIAENLYAQVNEQGHQQLIFWEIIGHRTNGEYTNEMPIKTGSNFHLPKTTKGWEIQVSFCNKSTAWLLMNEVRMSNPIELAEYAVMSRIAKEHGGYHVHFAPVEQWFQGLKRNIGRPHTSLV
jgi:hypothetical protein